MNLKFELSWGKNKNKQEAAPEPAVTEEPQSAVVVQDEMSNAEPEKYTLAEMGTIFEALKEEERRYYAKKGGDPNEVVAPISAGRSSVPQVFSNHILPGQKTPVHTDFPYEHLKYMQQLAMWNRHISRAVDNICTLGNTEAEINFDASVGDELAKEMRQVLADDSQNWYEFSEGEHSLDGDLLAQLAVTGCISAEWVPNLRLDGVSKVVRVDPYTIRFSYDRDKDIFLPMQKASLFGTGLMNRDVTGGYVDLNPITYKYIAMRRFNEMPTAIPPFFSAIEDIVMENDMVKNFQNMMRRLGMMGFLEVLLKMPKMLPNEGREQYYNRLMSELEKQRETAERGYHKGVVMGYKDEHDFKITAHPSPKAPGEFLDTVKKLIYTGTKQDPSMHGENFSTTETFARVILAKQTTQISTYQKTLAEFKSKVALNHLWLRGYKLQRVIYEYEAPTISDRKAEAEAEKIEIENSEALYSGGVIGQVEKAKRAGYEEPDQEEPRPMNLPAAAPGAQPAAAASSENEVQRERALQEALHIPLDREVNRLLYDLGAGRVEFYYHIPTECCPDHVTEQFIQITDFPEARMRRFVQAYVDGIDSTFTSFVNQAVSNIQADLRRIPDGTGENEVANLVRFGLFGTWGSSFTSRIDDQIEESISGIYNHYRKDENVFRNARGFASAGADAVSFFDIPAPVFTLLDTRAIEFLKSIDTFWLGKFITDEDTVRRINRFIDTELLGKNLTIGRDSEAMYAFVERFGDAVLGERWKIRRILETTANRARNSANALYLHQAQVTEFEVVEVNDERTCPWCNYMHGKSFSVSAAVQKIQQMTEANFSNLPEVAPFATSTPIEQFKKMDSATLQAAGFDVPSYHPHCRGRIVGKL